MICYFSATGGSPSQNNGHITHAGKVTCALLFNLAEYADKQHFVLAQAENARETSYFCKIFQAIKPRAVDESLGQ